MPKQDFRFHINLRVRWSECDAQGIVYNAAYMDYIEVAQADYYRNLGILLYAEKGRAFFDTATVKVTMEYKVSARIDDMLDVYTRISRIGNTSITVETEMYREGSDELLHWSEMIYVDYDADTSATRTVPDSLRTLFTQFEETGERLPLEQFPDLVSVYGGS